MVAAYAQPTHVVFGMVKVFHHTKNSVRRCCVGGGMAILIFGSFQKDGGYCKESNIFLNNNNMNVSSAVATFSAAF